MGVRDAPANATTRKSGSWSFLYNLAAPCDLQKRYLLLYKCGTDAHLILTINSGLKVSDDEMRFAWATNILVLYTCFFFFFEVNPVIPNIAWDECQQVQHKEEQKQCCRLQNSA